MVVPLKDIAIDETQNGQISAKSTEHQVFQGENEEHHDGPPHSLFTTPQKRWIVFIAALAGWFSTASSFIYFPGIPFMAQGLDVSVEHINLTVTSYLIASGIFPAITGSAADKYGRRPVFIISIGVYFVVNVALAVQRSFAALFVLRMVQSAAISGTFSIAYGVIGDLITPAERGGYTGVLSVFLNTPPSIAPLISGLLLIRWTWPSIFWFLSIVSPVVFVVMVLFLPETCRNIVGNGSSPAPLMNRPPFPFLCPPREKQTPISVGYTDTIRFPNPLAVIALLKNPGTLLAVCCFGIYYTIYSCLQASLSTVFVKVYGVSGLVAGVVYIPFGVGCASAAFLAGKILDRDYRKTAKAQGVVIDRRKGDDLSGFPIEYARLRTSKYFIAACAPLIAGYGWALEARVHMAVPLVLQFWIGFTNQLLFTSINTLLVDYHSDRPSSIQAANNLVRCELAAVGLAVLDIMIQKMGPGWCFVVFAALHLVTLPALWILEHYGLAWRRRRDNAGREHEMDS
ncbi:hypothetical protein G7046_g2152 [Stylonectria norvegica]|nr:hypothetical protein G7046_g2152 [Stylonectria norvegica]